MHQIWSFCCFPISTKSTARDDERTYGQTDRRMQRFVRPPGGRTTSSRRRLNPLKPTVAIWVQLYGNSDAQGWASECPDVKNYNWRLNPVWHRILYSCTHMATVGVKGLMVVLPTAASRAMQRLSYIIELDSTPTTSVQCSSLIWLEPILRVLESLRLMSTHTQQKRTYAL